MRPWGTLANIGFDLGFQRGGFEKQMTTLGGILKKWDTTSVAKAVTLIGSMLDKNPSVPLENLPGEVEGLTRTCEDLTKSRDGLTTEIASLEKSLEEKRRAGEAELQHMLDAAELTKNGLDEFKKDKAALAARGLDIEKMHDLERVMKECDEADYKSNRLIEKCKENDSLTYRHLKLQQELQENEKKNDELVSSNRELEPKLRAHQKALEQLAILQRIGMQEEELVKIREVMTLVSIDRRSARKDEVIKAMDDFLKHYRDCVYFQDWATFLEKEAHELKQEVERLQKTIADEEKNHGGRRKQREKELEKLDGRIHKSKG